MRVIEEPERTIYVFVEIVWTFCGNCLKERRHNKTTDGRVQCEVCYERKDFN